MITEADIKATVLDYAVDKCSPGDVLRLQRYFLREFIAWMPLRLIAEHTGARDHTVVLSSIKKVDRHSKLKPMAADLFKIFNQKLGHHWMLGNQNAQIKH